MLWYGLRVVIVRHYHTVHNALSNNHVHTLTCSCLCARAVIVGSCAVLRLGQCTAKVILPIFGHSAVQSLTPPSPSLSLTLVPPPSTPPPPLHVHDHRTLHTRHSSWPSKPSWAQPLNVLTSEQVRTTQALLTITDTYHRNSCYPLVFAFNHPPPGHQLATHPLLQKPSLS